MLNYNIVMSCVQDCSVEELEGITYTSRQLNSTSSSLQLFNLVVLCSLQQVESVKCAMLKCFDSVEVAYAYDKTAEVKPLLN